MNHKKTLIVLLVVVIVGAVGYFVWAQKSSITSTPMVQQTASQQPLDRDETSTNYEKWENTPAEIKGLSNKNNVTYLSIDILSQNPNFRPGVTDFFINQSKKLREVKMDSNTKFYECGAGPDNNDTSADVISNTKDFLTHIQKEITEKNSPLFYYFDITESIVENIYEQCLP